MALSPQQVKFEFLTYIKEFDVDAETWRVGSTDDAELALFVENDVDKQNDIWLWKPLLTSAEARIVLRYMTQQFGVPLADQSKEGPIVYLFRRSKNRKNHNLSA